VRVGNEKEKDWRTLSCVRVWGLRDECWKQNGRRENAKGKKFRAEKPSSVAFPSCHAQGYLALSHTHTKLHSSFYFFLYSKTKDSINIFLGYEILKKNII